MPEYFYKLLEAYNIDSPSDKIQRLCETIGKRKGPSDKAIFGFSEVSISYAKESSVKVRVLAECMDRVRIQPAVVDDIQALVLKAFSILQERDSLKFDSEKFSKIFRLVYDPYKEEKNSVLNFRFGLAIEAEKKKVPGLKIYFDLAQANSIGKTQEVLKGIFHECKLDSSFDWFQNNLLNREKGCLFRGVGIDFTQNTYNNLKLYLPGRYFSKNQMKNLLKKIGHKQTDELFDILTNFYLVNHTDTCFDSSSLVGLVFTNARNVPYPCAVKLDIFLPKMKADDLESSKTIELLAKEFGFKTEWYTRAINQIIDRENLADYHGTNTYFSLGFLPNNQLKINNYFRPIELETPKMNTKYLSRSKNNSLSRLDDAIRKGIKLLEEERTNGFQEALHRMTFPRSAGFISKEEKHVGWIYQYSVINDALLDALQAGFRVNMEALKGDVQKIVDSRLEGVKGGWKYFENLIELPPDSDDLAQVIILLAKLGGHDIEALCGPAIRLLLEQNSLPGGAFETWIVDKKNPGFEEKIQEKSIKYLWGDGPDNEVIANMMFALHIYDPKSYTAEIMQGIKYLEGKQKKDGNWEATWYWGPWYATYMCYRLFQAFHPGHFSSSRISRFLLENQQEDGGWGEKGRSTPLDTSFALLCAGLLMKQGLVNPEKIKVALGFLLENQSERGNWPGSPLIKMDTSRGLLLKNQPGAIISYQSDTLTSAFCLKALCQSRNILMASHQPF